MVTIVHINATCFKIAKKTDFKHSPIPKKEVCEISMLISLIIL